MMSYGALRTRWKLLQTRHHEIEEAWKALEGLPDDDENNLKRVQAMAALQVSKGRILEVELWQEWGERWPHIERADQLPTERNTVHHGAEPDTKTEWQGKRDRERLHRGNADQLLAALPDNPGERLADAAGDVRGAQL